MPAIHGSPVPTDLYDNILLFRFLNYFSQNASERTWTAKLSSLVSAKNAAAMKTAARAVSLAFAAEKVHDSSMAQAACEFYGNSLRYHQASFKAPPGKAICKKKAVNALPVTVLLSYFEMIQATSVGAWLNHTLAAERLFVLLGPDALGDELLNHLYFIVRSNSAIRCFLLGTRTQLLQQSWSEVLMSHPCGRGATVFNSLVDIIMWLSDSININTSSANLDLMSYHSSTLERTLSELRRLWVVFGENIALDTGMHPLLIDESDGMISISSVAELTLPALPQALHESSAALTAAFFHAAVILLLTLLHRMEISLPVSQTTYNYQQPAPWGLGASDAARSLSAMLHHSSQILALTQYLRTQRIGCTCLRMILPLAIVNRLSPSQHQSLISETMFRDWSTSDGLAGLASLAFGDKNKSSANVLLDESM